MDLFPLKVVITERILRSSDPYSSKNNVLALALKEALTPHIDMSKSSIGWGIRQGQQVINDTRVVLTTKESIDMTDISEPMSLTIVEMKI